MELGSRSTFVYILGEKVCHLLTYYANGGLIYYFLG